MNKKVIFITLAIIVLFGAAVSIFLYIAIFQRYSHREIVANVSVSTEWTEVPIEPALKIEKQIQNITLTVEGARFSTATKKNHLANGTVIEPEVELKDRDGRWHILRGGSGTVNDFDSNSNSFSARSLDFTVESENLPRNTRFVAVRLRSTEPFVSSKIGWTVYNMK